MELWRAGACYNRMPALAADPSLARPGDVVTGIIFDWS